MKVCPNCQTKYPDDGNFCPQEACATADGPRRLEAAPEEPRYKLGERLGGSRSGEVFRAEDSQTGAIVVYKRIARASQASAAVQERSLRELKQLQRAQSPRIPRVLDFGREPDGQLFVVTDVCQGVPLDRLVAEAGALPLDRAKKIAAQVGEALLEGQKVGVVHHDLAPKNVLVGAGDEVKVINFVAPCPVTETIFGVPAYLSPEQAEGKLVDQRSNTYGLGALVMLMLTGQPPVPQGGDGDADAASTLEQVRKGEIVAPSLRAAGLNAEIDRVILKAMDRNPNRRPLTLRQFLNDVAGLVVAPSPPPDTGRNAGFAKTMMFAGGSPEVQKLVNQATAARAEANGAGAQARGASSTPAVANVPAGQPAESQTTPPPVAGAGTSTLGPKRTHGAAVAATMVALPAAGSQLRTGVATPAPAPVAASESTSPGGAEAPVSAVPMVSQAAPVTASGGTPKPGTAFRETLWFKQGDVDQMVADARAKIEAARGKAAAPPEPELPVEDVKPLEDRYRDDGTVTVDDRKKYSLRSGATSAGLPTVGGAIPGERMSTEEMIGEIGGGKRIAIVAVAVIVVAAVIGALVYVARGKKHPAEGAAEQSPGAAAVASQPAPAPPAAAPTPAPPAAVAPPTAPPAPAPAAPAVAASAEIADGPPTAAAKPESARPVHKRAAKKSRKKRH